MKYFITGGAGFIGSHLVDHLLAKPENTVTVFDNFVTGQRKFLAYHSQDRRLAIIEGDMLDFKALRSALSGHHHVFHLAANADIALGLEKTDLDLKQTVLATYNLLEAMRLAKIERIVYSSGSGIYGDVGATETAEDFGPLLPISMYGATKLAAEGLISAFCHMFEMKAWIFRFANVVGGRQTHGVGFDFIRKLKDNPLNLLVLGDGEQSKSYIHVSDVISAIDRAIESAGGRVSLFNVGTGDFVTVNHIARIVMEEMGLKDTRIAHTGGDRGWKGDVPVVRLDTQRIISLGWRPKYNSADAIRHSVRTMLKAEGSGQ